MTISIRFDATLSSFSEGSFELTPQEEEEFRSLDSDNQYYFVRELVMDEVFDHIYEHNVETLDWVEDDENEDTITYHR